MKLLPNTYYQHPDVVFLARNLLGKILYTRINGVQTSGMIIETEAYNGVDDKACHAWGGRKTQRTQIMYRAGGIAYVYLCYGVHALFNIVTGKPGVPQAVLIRAIMPLEGLEIMCQRRNKKRKTKEKNLTLKEISMLTGGPGKLTQATGITTKMNGHPLRKETIWVEEYMQPKPDKILSGPRIGVNYAGEDAKRPYRFRITPKELKLPT